MRMRDPRAVMESVVKDDTALRFDAPKRFLGDLDAATVAHLLATSSDIALVVDEKGVIRDLAFGDADLARMTNRREWMGRPWVETVAPDSRDKVEALIRDPSAQGARWRHVNHVLGEGEQLPIRYASVRTGAKGMLLAFGRDLRPDAAMQQRVLEAQQAIERSYSRLRQAEARYRLLFQNVSEAVLVVDGASFKVVEANPSVGRLLGRSAERIVGSHVATLFQTESAASIDGLLTAVRASGRGDDVKAHPADVEPEFLVSASLFRQGASAQILVRLTPMQTETPSTVRVKADDTLAQVVERLPDGFVATDEALKIVAVNGAFLDLAQLAAEDQALGASLDKYVGRSGVDLSVLISNVREHGSIRHFSSVLRGEYGSIEDVEIAAVTVPNDDQLRYGFSIRSAGRRFLAGPDVTPQLPRSVEQLTGLVGRVPLKEIVRETTDLIERLCIEAALELTGDNRASAAEMLGLSRQSLYAKMRRYNLGNLG